MQSFQNGPTPGNDVFIPIDNVIGGVEQAGKGWKMLMSALAAGRGISLPSLSAAAGAAAAHTTGAYARVREQFNVPIGRFEGMQERSRPNGGDRLPARRRAALTCAGIDQGQKPAVIIGDHEAAGHRAHARCRSDDAMDVHGGKGDQDGPRNYLGRIYRSVPVGITVEGANILTRALIVFGQGAIRCHPYLLKEMEALADEDRARGLDEFDKVFWKHVGHSFTNAFRAWGRAPGRAASSRRRRSRAARATSTGSSSRYTSAFALAVDFAMLTLGGGLKRREMLSARFGDILSELFLLSAVLKRWEDEGRQAADLPLVHWCMEEGFATIETRFDR